MSHGTIELMDLSEFTALCLLVLPSSTIKSGYLHVLDHKEPGKHFKLITIRAAMSQFPTCLIGTLGKP